MASVGDGSAANGESRTAISSESRGHLDSRPCHPFCGSADSDKTKLTLLHLTREEPNFNFTDGIPPCCREGSRERRGGGSDVSEVYT